MDNPPPDCWAKRGILFIPDLAKKDNDDLVKDILLSEHVFHNVKGNLEIATSGRTGRSPILDTSIIAIIWSGYERRQELQGESKKKGHPQVTIAEIGFSPTKASCPARALSSYIIWAKRCTWRGFQAMSE